jgi:amicyanin
MKTFSRQFTVLLVNMMLIACAQPAAKAADNNQPDSAQIIKIDNFSFTPAELHITAGATVKWTNRDDIPHNIVSSEQKFKSKPLDTDDSFSFTFSTPGTYQYFCGLHPKMVGKIIVEAAKK